MFEKIRLLILTLGMFILSFVCYLKKDTHNMTWAAFLCLMSFINYCNSKKIIN